MSDDQQQPAPVNPNQQKLADLTEEQLMMILSDPVQTSETGHMLFALETCMRKQAAALMTGLMANQIRSPAPVQVLDGIGHACGMAFKLHRQWVRDMALMRMRYMQLRAQQTQPGKPGAEGAVDSSAPGDVSA